LVRYTFTVSNNPTPICTNKNMPHMSSSALIFFALLRDPAQS
jgi:hypothetical protein